MLILLCRIDNSGGMRQAQAARSKLYYHLDSTSPLRRSATVLASDIVSHKMLALEAQTADDARDQARDISQARPSHRSRSRVRAASIIAAISVSESEIMDTYFAG